MDGSGDKSTKESATSESLHHEGAARGATREQASNPEPRGSLDRAVARAAGRPATCLRRLRPGAGSWPCQHPPYRAASPRPSR